jgi:geranylgeranyl pyrophosphate synthase
MNLGKLGQAITGKEIFDLIHDDLERVEKEISVETVASVEVVTQIGQYLQESGGKRLRPSLLLLASKLIGPSGRPARAPSIWARWSRLSTPPRWCMTT